MKKFIIVALSVLSFCFIYGNEITKKTIIYADDYPDLQAAIDALPYPGGKVILSAREYRLNNPLNLTNIYNNGNKTRWLTLEGAGKLNTIISGNFPEDAVIDATCAGYMTMRDLTITGKSKALLLCARNRGSGGGGNVFENIMFRGDSMPPRSAAVWLVGSEVNRFFNCAFQTRQEDSIGIVFAPVPEVKARGISYSIKSAYEPNMTGSSTTELSLFGCIMGIFGYNSIGLYAQGSTADISIFGGYFANSGFSAIYLNGTHANVGDVAVRNLRIEGETGKYCLYATGAVRNLLVDSGNWGSAGEVICYESAKEGYAAGLPAENWVIRNCSLSIQNQAKRHGSWKKEGTRKTGEDLEHIPREKRSIIRADKLINARLENIWIRAYEIVRKQVPSDKQTAEKNDYGTVIQNMPFTEKEVLEWFTPKLITIADTAKNNYIQTEKETSVILPKNASGNIIRTTNDDGNSREYRGSGNVTNLTVQSIDSVKNPKIGDIILTKHQEGLALAVYNGTEWSYSKLQAGN